MATTSPPRFHMDILLESDIMKNPNDAFKMCYPSIASPDRVIVSTLCQFFSSKLSP